MSFLNPFAFLLIALSVYLFFDLWKQTAHPYLRRKNRLLLIALVFSLLAFARPVTTQEEGSHGILAGEYVVALDVSFSMSADDILPSRFEAARENAVKLISSMPKDRFSVFVFTSNALLVSPPTNDSAISTAALLAINPEYILTKSTSIANLLDAIAKFSKEKKELILFSDGGEETDIAALVQKAKAAGVIVDVVAVGSSRGALLKKGATPLVDSNENLVVSRVNPLLESLAEATGGFYVRLDSAKDIAKDIRAKLRMRKQKHLQTESTSYEEWYFLFLLIAYAALLLAYTKGIEYLRFLVFVASVFLISNATPLEASLFEDGHTLFRQQKYEAAAKRFMERSKSVRGYYNAGVAYCKAGLYKKALETFSSIKTRDRMLKSMIFYNMAYCAVRLGRYERAKKLFQKALALNPNDKEAKENLLYLYRKDVKEKKDVADMMPHTNDKQRSFASKSNEQKSTQENTKASQRHTNRRGDASAASGYNAKRSLSKRRSNSQSLRQERRKYKTGYNAYELINKGYIHESRPW